MTKLVFHHSSLFLLLGVAAQSIGQLPYTTALHSSVVAEVDTEYGVAIGFDGIMDTLKLDVYKPVGDNNCLRPLMIFVHGGAWIGGDKAGGQVPFVCDALAERGWVVASINYRLGMHPTASHTPYALCNPSPFDDCARAADTTEFYRANYRAMQDAKGTIRYMKDRASQDSTDINNVFIAGESAGAFIAMLTAYMDDPSEKPTQCMAQPDAPLPDADLASCVDVNANRTRPDLGPVDGTLHAGFVDATVKGVGSFFGGLMDTSIVQGVDTPAVYMFHQTNDVIVSSGRRRLLSALSYQCLGGICEPFYHTPISYGNGWLRNWWQSSTSAPNYTANIVNNWTGTIFDCTANGHSIDAIQARVTNMTELFSPIITASGNDPATNCMTVGVDEASVEDLLQVFPNPSEQHVLHVNCGMPIRDLEVHDLSGRRVRVRSFQTSRTSLRLQLQYDIKGVMLVRVVNEERDLLIKRVVIL